MTNFISFIICAVLASVVYKSLAQGLIKLSDQAMRTSLGMKFASDLEVMQRHPRLVACWDYFQSVTVGAVFSLLILLLRQAFVDMGGRSWLYSLVALAWTVTTGIGFKTNPGSVFFSCAVGVGLGLFVGPWASLASWCLFLLILIPMLKSRVSVFTEDQNFRAGKETVVVDVEAE